MNNIKYSEIYRVYRDGLNLNIMYVNSKVSTITCKSEEDMTKLITGMKEEAAKQLMHLEVYNGLNEAKSH